MPEFEDLDRSPSICLDPGIGGHSQPLLDLTDHDLPFARAAMKFACGAGSLDDVITEAQELQAYREWQKIRNQSTEAA